MPTAQLVPNLKTVLNQQVEIIRFLKKSLEHRQAKNNLNEGDDRKV